MANSGSCSKHESKVSKATRWGLLPATWYWNIASRSCREGYFFSAPLRMREGGSVPALGAAAGLMSSAMVAILGPS